MLFLFMGLCVSGSAQNPVKIDYTLYSEKEIVLHSMTNVSSDDVEIIIYPGSIGMVIPAGEKISCNDMVCTSISLNQQGGNSGGSIWNPRMARKEWESLKVAENSATDVVTKTEEKTVPQVTEQNVVVRSAAETPAGRKKVISMSELVATFTRELENDSYFSDDAVEHDAAEIDVFLDALEDLAEEEEKTEYISRLRIREYLQAEGKLLEERKIKADRIVEEFLSRYYVEYEIPGLVKSKDELLGVLTSRLDRREEALGLLADAINSVDVRAGGRTTLPSMDVIVICLTVLVVLLVFVLVSRKKKDTKKTVAVSSRSNDASPAIVVRRKTTSILKRQSLDDVIGNDEYLALDTSDFCVDSAVRRIYIKNTCIKEIYNMYEEDLRNPSNPKEDGCMVLGRWVYDEGINKYDVSLEYTVMPGDDAVFQEYELNFGGKIKLKIAERLRKLRAESNLQYDLTCWVHSHPGLGVFFSNSDNNVQMQLKHPSHPNFLTAMVIDILTPQQETGIFTFRQDSSINSKNDLKKMYSLEEMYRWALDSERQAFRSEDYYNVLANASVTDDNCRAVYLNNGAIIDISSIIAEQPNGISGWIKGHSGEYKGNRIWVAKSAVRSDMPGSETVGCLFVGANYSIPSIRKALSANIANVRFVLFYSTTDMTLTCIPVIGSQLCVDQDCYGEDKIENLKIWTRRKR